MKIDTTGKVAYWCKTEELAKEFLRECDEQGIVWWNKRKASDDLNYNNITKTCYCADEKGLSFGSMCYLDELGYTLIEYKGKDTQNVAKNKGDHDDIKNRKEQIEEMAKLMLQGEIDREKGNIDCAEFDYITQFKAGLQRLAGAKSLYEAGYRKQSDTARDIIEMLKAAKGVVKVHFEAYDELINNIVAQYGVEVE